MLLAKRVADGLPASPPSHLRCAGILLPFHKKPLYRYILTLHLGPRHSYFRLRFAARLFLSTSRGMWQIISTLERTVPQAVVRNPRRGVCYPLHTNRTAS